VSTLSSVELGVLGPLQVRQFGLPVAIPGAKPRAILTMLGLYGGSVVPGETLVELLWGSDPPRTAAKALQTHISTLRRALGDGFVLTQGAGWTLSTAEIDAIRYAKVVGLGREAMAAGDASQAVGHFDEALRLWRGAPELPDGRRGATERTRWVEGHAALVEDRADALLATGRAAELIGELEATIADAPLRERRWAQLMLALYRAGRQGEALAAYQRVRELLAEELGVDPGPDLRRLNSKIVAQDASLEPPVSQHLSSVMRAVTFLLTDIEGSTAAWELDAESMGEALARHDEIVEQVVTFGGGRLIKTRGEGDATFSVFDRPSAAAVAAVELQEAIRREPWTLAGPMRIRIALHTGEVEFRDGDYFGRAVNRAARLRSLANGGQILCSGATAELVIDSLACDVVLADLGMRQLKNLARPEHVFELRLHGSDASRPHVDDGPLDRPAMPAVLTGPGPFVGRGCELEGLLAAWQATLTAGTRAVLIAGEPGVGKTRLAGEWSHQAYGQGAVVVYGRCDEDLGAPYQPFAEALRTLVPCLGGDRLRGLRGVESLLPLVPALTDMLPDLAAAPRAAPEAERYALFDAVVGLLGVASASAPIVLILDDLHWAAKPTLLLLRHLLRFGEQARVQIVGTYRSTDLDRSHPLAAMLADLHRDGSATRLGLGGLDEDDVTTYVAEAGYSDEELGRALALVTGGNPFFLIEALRHVDESGGRWDPNSLPQGVREAVSRRLSRLPAESNTALAAAAVVGSRFAVDLIERVIERDLVDAFDEAGKAGIIIEEPGGRYRFNHALVRQSLLAELPSVRRMRLHQKIAAALECEQGGADDERLAELAYHYFECAWAGNAAKAVEYCRRAADQAMARLAYEGAADLYGKALQALDELDDELPDRDDLQAELLVARCEALLAAGDVVSATGAVAQLSSAAEYSSRLAAWGKCFEGQLSMLTDPGRLDEMESAVGAAAETLAGLQDAAGEAKAHTVRAGCLARLGRVGDCEIALDQALNAARRAREHRRVNAVLAGAPLAALWGPNPVPRAGGRCLDVVRLLRITTGSPVVEATSTRCQGVLDALRGRAAAGRQLIDSARRTLNELGMRHAALEVEQFAGIIELIADDAIAAERHLVKAYNGFRRMGLDADTAETAALLARACLALERDADANELCTESEQLAGHAFKAAIAWRSVRARLLSRDGDHDEARRVAEEAVTIAEHTDALVDHGDACLALASVLDAAGDAAGAQAAAERAVALYELKGAVALAEKARRLLTGGPRPGGLVATEAVTSEPENRCFRVGQLLVDAVERQAWGEVEHLLADEIAFESRRMIVGVAPIKRSRDQWRQEMGHYVELGITRYPQRLVATRGDRLALVRLSTSTHDASFGAPRDEFLQLAGIDEEGRVCLQLWFDVEDLDAALAELEKRYAGFEAERPRLPLENRASRVDARGYELFAEGRIDDIGALLAEDHRAEDRRQGLRSESRGRSAALDNIRAIADLGAWVTNTPLALRGELLCLSHIVFERYGSAPDEFRVETLELADLDPSGVIRGRVVFDVADLDAAIVELDARYLAGEAAPYARTWSVVMGAYAAFNRRETAATSPGWVNIDHRRATAFAPGHMTAYLSAAWADSPDTRIYIEAVHRLSEFEAVVTHSAKGMSQAGFEAEWRDVNLLTVEGDLVTRSELFDAHALEAALARSDELSRPAACLANTASRIYERWLAAYGARDWAAMSQVMAEGIVHDDHRRVVNGGTQRGRDAVIGNMRAIADVGVNNIDPFVIATRGERLALARQRVSGDKRPDAFGSDVVIVIEVDSDDRLVGGVAYDPDDVEAAFAELDARFIAGEAATHSPVWSLISHGYAMFNAHETPPTTGNWVIVDHRLGTPFDSGDLAAYRRAERDVLSDFTMYVESVHRLSDRGAVVTHAGAGTSRDGFGAEWRMIAVLVTGAPHRCEFFDEADLAAALARFDEVASPLKNKASRVGKRLRDAFAARDWATLAGLLAENLHNEDRRRVVNGGIRRGRDSMLEDMRAAVEVDVLGIGATEIATRGERLVLVRGQTRYGDQPQAFRVDNLAIAELDADGRITAQYMFDPDDIDAAFAELDARYLAGEAAAHAHIWSLVTETYAAFNRHELSKTTPDWVNIDHRLGVGSAPGEMNSYVGQFWALVPDISTHIEVVHRLSGIGAVFTHTERGKTSEGFDAEWREIALLTFHGDAINRCELFDETDLDAAVARFDELNRPATCPENLATQAYSRVVACFAARDWDALGDIVADDVLTEDRRRVVNVGSTVGRNALIAEIKAIADIGVTGLAGATVATRGGYLSLNRAAVTVDPHDPEAFRTDIIDVVETRSDGRVVARVLFDPDDIDAAFAELTARWIASGEVAHPEIIEAVGSLAEAANRHDWNALAARHAGASHVNHRQLASGAGAAVEDMSSIPMLATFVPDVRFEVAEILACSATAVMSNVVVKGTSTDDVAIEMPWITLMVFDGDRVLHAETFDGDQRELALARFNELSSDGTSASSRRGRASP
jgi:DNA-binding SARP family transcriptional activator/predicted ester cyclase